MRLDVQISGIEQISALQRLLSPASFAKAQKAGVSYAAKAVPPAVAKGISSAYNITSSRVKQDISRFAFDPDGQSATIRFSRRPPTLSQFKPNPGTRGHQRGLGRGKGWAPAKPAGKPLTATIIKADRRQPFTGAFVAIGQNSNNLVLRRTSSGRLIGVYGPSIGSIFLGKSRIGENLRSDVRARIAEQYSKGFERAMDQAARGFG